jgi:hypothetical protein
MANLASNRLRRSRFTSPLQLSSEPILLTAQLLAQPNYGDNTVAPLGGGPGDQRNDNRQRN